MYVVRGKVMFPQVSVCVSIEGGWWDLSPCPTHLPPWTGQEYPPNLHSGRGRGCHPFCLPLIQDTGYDQAPPPLPSRDRREGIAEYEIPLTIHALTTTQGTLLFFYYFGGKNNLVIPSHINNNSTK